MPLPQRYLSSPLFISFIAAALAIAVQIQVSLFKSGDYLGLRINLADLIIPFAGTAILMSLLLKKSSWPDWRIKHVYIWLLILTAVMTMALISGYLQTDVWSRWALINKFCGWFVLMGFFGLGGWLSSNLNTEFQRIFIKWFCLFFLLVAIADISYGLYYLFGPIPPKRGYFQLAGLMYNRNAYVFLLLAVTVIFAVFTLEKQSLLGKKLQNAFWFFLPLAFILNGSRTGWIVGGLLFTFLTFNYRRKFFVNVLPWFLAGSLVALALFHIMDADIFMERQFARLAEIYGMSMDGAISDVVIERRSEGIRFRGFSDALAWWREHPLTGIGLGSFLHYSRLKYEANPGVIIDLIDCSLLWLLAETGLIGALMFVAFYARTALSLWRDGRGNRGFNGRFLWIVFLIMLIFGVMSVLHELLYTRFLWLFLGLAMARVPAETPANDGGHGKD